MLAYNYPERKARVPWSRSNISFGASSVKSNKRLDAVAHLRRIQYIDTRACTDYNRALSLQYVIVCRLDLIPGD